MTAHATPPAPIVPVVPHLGTDFGLTDELLAHLRREEGWVPRPYRCPGGYPTIGYGHRIPSMKHAPITLEEGERLLRADLRAKRDAVLAISPSLAGASPRRLAAILDFAFNCGEGAYKASQLRKAVDRGDWREAAVQMRRWIYAAGEVHAGLKNRRAMAARWLEQG